VNPRVQCGQKWTRYTKFFEKLLLKTLDSKIKRAMEKQVVI
jgi:hypothetical protein